MRLRTLVLAAIAATLPFQAGCDWEAMAGGNDRFQEDFQYSYDLSPGGRVFLETFNGSVEVVSWEREEVRITGTKYAREEQDMRSMRVDIESHADSIRIRVVRPDNRRGSMGARFFLRVPRKVELERIATSNGPIRVEDIRGTGRLQTSNGAVRISRFDGSLTARTSNSSVECLRLAGDAQLRTSNGSIRVENANASLDAETSNSSIHLLGFEPVPGAPVKLSTSNGTIDARFDRLESSDVRASTTNSSITLRLPADTRARLLASTSNSRVSTDFEVSGSVEKHRIDGSINGGGPLIRLTSSNGSIRIEKL